MSADYLVPASDAVSEYIVKKSQFIAHVKRISSEEEALSFIDEIKNRHPDATHNVWAYCTRDGAIRWSDDGEPGGTAGSPTMGVFRSANVCDVCCVVTRYFGGILLGSGGLVRAYSKAASEALSIAGIARVVLWSEICVKCSYSLYERVCRVFESFGNLPEKLKSDFAEDVSVIGIVPSDDVKSFTHEITQLSSATATVSVLGEAYYPQKAE
ncbi:MAG: YigZ family protein [Ruminococcaceae bacterium]|nr:YigZ family protein [Oscillospiraceae bacterium]